MSRRENDRPLSGWNSTHACVFLDAMRVRAEAGCPTCGAALALYPDTDSATVAAVAIVALSEDVERLRNEVVKLVGNRHPAFVNVSDEEFAKMLDAVAGGRP